MQTRNTNILSKFSAVRRIKLGPKRKLPFVQQMEWSDCGAACLAMLLGYFQKNVPLARVREEFGLSRDGVSAKNIVEVGRRFGLVGRGVKLDIEQLSLLKRGAILHWEFRHFVVFDRLVGKKVRILDPAQGPRDVPLDEFARCFTGVALEFEPGQAFAPESGQGSFGKLRRYAAELLGERRVFVRIVAISLLLRVLALVVPLLTSVIVDQVVPRSDKDLLLVAALAVVSMTMFNAVCKLVARICSCTFAWFSTSGRRWAFWITWCDSRSGSFSSVQTAT